MATIIFDRVASAARAKALLMAKALPANPSVPVQDKKADRRVAQTPREYVEQQTPPDWRATCQTMGDCVLVPMTCSRFTLRG